MNTLKQLWLRLGSETPKFWQKVLKLGAALTALSVTLLADTDGVFVPEIFRTIAGYAATAGFVITALAKATTTNQQLSNED